jgi:hypothetical protein
MPISRRAYVAALRCIMTARSFSLGYTRTMFREGGYTVTYHPWGESPFCAASYGHREE